MSENQHNDAFHGLKSMLLGLFCFLISGLLANIVIKLTDNYILATLVAGGAGGLLLGVFLGMRQERIKMAVSGIIGMPISLMLSFFVVEGIGAILPSIVARFEDSGVPDVSAIVLMGFFFGLTVGAIIHGKKSILLFSIVGGLTALPFGILVAAMNTGWHLKVLPAKMASLLEGIDANFLAMCLALGMGAGLSLGLYSRRIFKKGSIE